MTSPDTGSSRPGRVAGIALLGLAAVALVIGLVTVLGGDGDGRADGNGEEQPPRPPSSTSRSATTTSGQQTSSQPPSGTSAEPTTTKSTTSTTASGQPPPGGDGNGEPAKSVPVRVLNNSKVSRLASRAADDFKAQGWQVTDVGNYSATNVPTTTAYYRPGTDEEEAAARSLASAFGLDVEPRLDTIKDLPAGVIVIVTGDYGTADGDDGSKNDG